MESQDAADLDRLVVEGNPRDLDRTDTLILGRLVADQLGVITGDDVTLLVPTVGVGDLPEVRLREFRVVGLFEAGIQDHDATLAFANLDTLLALGAARSGSVGLSIQVGDALAAPGVALRSGARARGRWGHRRTRPRLDPGSRQLLPRHPHREDHDGADPAAGRGRRGLQHRCDAGDGRDGQAHRHRHPAHAGRGSRAVLPVLSSTQGLVIGWAGVIAGVVLGVLLARNVDPILGLLNRTLGLQLFDADVFYITRVPSELHAMDVLADRPAARCC